MNLLPERKFTEQEKNARIQLNSALSQLMQGNKSGALKAFRQALALDPSLAREKIAANLAQELTGLPIQEALQSLADADASKDMIKTARKQDHRSTTARRKPPSFAALLFLALLVVLIGMTVVGVTSGRINISQLTILQYAGQKYYSDDYEYYAIVPGGEAPEGGWNVVVAFHGLNGKAENMIYLAKNFTDEGAIFVAPTFGTYALELGGGPIEPMSQILSEVANKYTMNPRGAVLLGLSQGGSFAYRFSVYHPEQVYGVVTAGSPGFYDIYDNEIFYPARFDMPYIFTWGELDGLQDFVVPQDVKPLQDAGYNIAVYFVPEYGHQMTPFAVEQTLNMIR